MPTVIDRFVVELGLDPKKFTQAQREVMQSFKLTQHELATRGNEIERTGRSAGQAFSNLRAHAIGLLAVFTGGSLIAFTSRMALADATVGRLSRNIGVSTPTISAWQGALRLAGGEAGDAANSFKAISDVFAGWKIGIVSPAIADFRAISAAGGTVIDVNKSVEQSFIDLADNLKKIHDDPAQGPAIAGVLGGRIPGMTPAFFDLLIKGGAEVRKVLDEVKSLGGATDESAAAAARLNAEYQKTVLILENIGRRVVVLTAKPLISYLEKWTGVASPELGKGTSLADKIVRFFQNDAEQRRAADAENSMRPATGNEYAPAPPRPGGAIPVKPGAGLRSQSMDRLANDLQRDVPGINRFTSFNDPYHALLGGGSAHSGGRALDFTIKDASKSEEIANQIRAQLKTMGVDATVIDEYKNPSKNSTAPHIHVQFNTRGAASKYLEVTDAARNAARTAPALPDVATGAGAGAGAVGPGASNDNRTNTTTITVGTVVVNTPATDGPGVARDFKDALERNSFAANANGGQS